MTLGSTQPLNRNEYRRFSFWDKDGLCVELTTLPPSCADCLEILGTSTSWTPKGLSRPVAGKLYLFYLNRFQEHVELYPSWVSYLHYFVLTHTALCLLS